MLFPTLSSFVDMDREEMEYVDGGYEVTKGIDVYTAWWGVQVYLNNEYSTAVIGVQSHA